MKIIINSNERLYCQKPELVNTSSLPLCSCGRLKENVLVGGEINMGISNARLGVIKTTASHVPKSSAPLPLVMVAPLGVKEKL